MFGKDKKEMAHQFDTLIAHGAELVGDITFRGGLHIDGRIRGNVLAEDGAQAVVRLSDKGEVEGEIRAPHIIINGVIKGDVYSSEHLELAAKASVTGNVYYNMIEMVMGAEVNGSLMHSVGGHAPSRNLSSISSASLVPSPMPAQGGAPTPANSAVPGGNTGKLSSKG